MKRKSWLGSILLALVLIIAPNLLMPGVSAANENNHPSTWEAYFEAQHPGLDVTCAKPWDGRLKKTFTIPDGAWSGSGWIGVVVKAGSGPEQNTIFDPSGVGASVFHSTGKDISHIIICWCDPPAVTEVPVPAMPPVIDECNEPGVTSNVRWDGVPSGSTGVVWTLNADGSYTANTLDGHVFADGTNAKTFYLPADSGESCYVPPTVVTFEAPRFEDPCNEYGETSNVAWAFVPVSNAEITVVVDGGNVTVTPNAGYAFAEGTQTVFTLPADNGEACYVPPTELPIPARPLVTDVCNPVGVTSNVAWSGVPSGPTGVEWALNADGSYTASTTAGYVFAGGTTSHTFHLPADSGESCYVPPSEIPVPAKPPVQDPCNPVGVAHNATWVVPANTATVTWTLQADGHLLANSATGYVFTTGGTLIDFGIAEDDLYKCAVTPY